MRDNFYRADLSEQEQVMLEFVGKLTLDQQHLTAEDLQRLRDAGFTEVQLLEIVQLTAWFNYMTRVADALGVEVEAWREEWRDYVFDRTAEAKP